MGQESNGRCIKRLLKKESEEEELQKKKKKKSPLTKNQVTAMFQMISPKFSFLSFMAECS